MNVSSLHFIIPFIGQHNTSSAEMVYSAGLAVWTSYRMGMGPVSVT